MAKFIKLDVPTSDVGPTVYINVDHIVGFGSLYNRPDTIVINVSRKEIGPFYFRGTVEQFMELINKA